MVRALVWKELRAQWAVCLTVAVGAAVGVAGLRATTEPVFERDLSFVLWLAAWGYGMFCGALLLAGETEDRTQTFLDGLPGTRWLLWRVKACIGLVLLATETVALLGIDYAILREGLARQMIELGFLSLFISALVGYAWGLFCGSFAPSVLSAVGWAALLQALAVGLACAGGMVLVDLNQREPFALVGVLVFGGLPGIATAWSAWIYCDADRLRLAARASPGVGPAPEAWGAVFRLAAREVIGIGVLMAVAGVAAAVSVSIFGNRDFPLMIWFAVTLGGVTTFADEQRATAGRLPGDGLFPLDRFRLVKAGFRLVVGVACAGFGASVVATGVVVRANLTQQFLLSRSARLAKEQIALAYRFALWLPMWLACGYVAGLLAATLFRAAREFRARRRNGTGRTTLCSEVRGRSNEPSRGGPAMTRVLVWKEIREQRVVWLALALAATGGVAGLYGLWSPNSNRDELLSGVLWLTAWGYGLLCGALLLAGEVEDGTQAFLDALPAARRRLWRVKAWTGLALVVAQAAALAVVGVALFRGRYAHGRATGDVVGLLFCGGVGYAWGLFCGSYAPNVLGAVARAMGLQLVAGLALFFFLVLPLEATVFRGTPGSLLTLSMAALGLGAIGAGVRSRTIYCRPDLLRRPITRRRGAGVAPAPSSESPRLTWRQSRRFALGMALFGVLGMAAVAGLGVMVWPLLTLLIGVFCGVTTFAGGLPSGEPPSAREKLVRAGVRLALGVGAILLTAFPVAAAVGVTFGWGDDRGGVRRLADRLRVSAAAGLVTEPVAYLALWSAYGYAAGLLFGRIVRGPVVAAAAAAAVAGALAAPWAPCVLFGSPVHVWQLWGVPAVFLAATLFLTRAHTAYRPSPARAAGVAAGAVVAAGLLQAAGLWYRAGEIPASPDAPDLAAFAAHFPAPEENAGGRLTTAALRRLVVIERTFREEPSDLPLPAPGRPRPEPVTFFTYVERVRNAAEQGWNPGDGRLGAFLDRVFDDPWATGLAEAAKEPTGTLVDPRGLNRSSAIPEVFEARNAAILLVARGLQRQEDGDPAAFVEYLRTGLALARNLRHRTIVVAAYTSQGVESWMARGVEHWLEGLDGRPDLLRRALQTLQQHLREPQSDPAELRTAEFLAALNTLADPGTLQRNGNGADPFFPWALNDTALLRLCWAAPWERVRTRRALDAFASYDPDRERRAGEQASFLVKNAIPAFGRMLPAKYPRPYELTPALTALLRVALRLYQQEVGRPAEDLNDLVPRYLDAVPADPYDGLPFRYRLSRGETLDRPPDPLLPGPQPQDREVPAGQGILWCVGEDGRDDGGRQQERLSGPGNSRVGDVIFLVPLPPARR